LRKILRKIKSELKHVDNSLFNPHTVYKLIKSENISLSKINKELLINIIERKNKDMKESTELKEKDTKSQNSINNGLVTISDSSNYFDENECNNNFSDNFNDIYNNLHRGNFEIIANISNILGSSNQYEMCIRDYMV
jgi:hypothetical protein